MQAFNFTRAIPVEDQYDVLVCGGGPAGSAAAISAARSGAKVLLVEATGCLGGMSTSGLVCTFGPMGDGERTLVGGFTRELIETMHARGFLAQRSRRTIGSPIIIAGFPSTPKDSRGF